MMTDKNNLNVHHIAFHVHDFDKSVAFYANALGLNVRYTWGEKPKRAAMLGGDNGQYLELFEGSDGPKEGKDMVIEHFALRVPNCDEAFAKAVSAGAVVQMEPKDVTIAGTPSTVVRIAFVKGPDNEVFEFFENDML
jgi:catechol 2,3-dioxygenase-like lactoylglutathione lyase family enzyme